jgi:hypothetical protein
VKVAGDKQDALDKQPQAKTARAPARANPKNPGLERNKHKNQFTIAKSQQRQ